MATAKVEQQTSNAIHYIAKRQCLIVTEAIASSDAMYIQSNIGRLKPIGDSKKAPVGSGYLLDPATMALLSHEGW